MARRPHPILLALLAVTVATACVLDNAVTQGIAEVPAGRVKTVSVEHPTGEFSVELGLDAADPQKVVRAALLRTARPIMRGEVLTPDLGGNATTKKFADAIIREIEK